MTRLVTLPLLAALGCPSSEDSDPVVGNTCPALDCSDAISLFVVDPEGAPALSFSGTVTVGADAPVDFSCSGTKSWFDAGICNEDGSVALWVYGETLSVSVTVGPDAPSFAGDIAPTWTAPYDSEECGHYCYIAQETVQLVACEGCG